ncbi:MAG: CHAD domain-containing protein [Planctomycetia bacterium]|nr:CHAD domain-containing protein [Planctomycetia bacterium]
MTTMTKSSEKSGKWMSDLRPEMPASQAAQATLERRLEPVWKWSAAAAKAKEGATRPVHQLRVAVRRAMAAMQGYAELLPRRKATKIEAKLHKLRRRAGEARDFDVLLGRLVAHPDAERLKPLTERIAELRVAAQKPIVRLHRKLKKRGFHEDLHTLIEKVRAPKHSQETTFSAWARHGLSRAVDVFFAAGAADMSDTTLLHHFRIEGKQLRYAMEYFSAAFGPELRKDLYADIEKVQALLGTVNDHASALAHYEAWKSEWDDPSLAQLLEELIAGERNSVTGATQEFFAWWTKERSDDLRRRFDATLQLPNEEHAA